MGARSGVTEQDMCAGNPKDAPEMFLCGQPATIALTQLRPGYTMQDTDSAAPFLVVIGVCRGHVGPVRKFLEVTWPHDQVDVYGLAFLRANWESLEGLGAPVMELVNTA
jgi:hypothetical protein